MVIKKVLCFVGAGYFLSLGQGLGALMGINPPSSSPYFADFRLNDLVVANEFNGSSATLTITTEDGDAREHYTSGAESAGTHGSDSLGPSHNNNFAGSFSLTAHLSLVHNAWILQSGAFTVSGNLMGGSRREILLTGSLLPGHEGPAGSYGFGRNSRNGYELDFLYTTVRTANPTPYDAAILQDWTTDNPFRTTAQGGMIFTWPWLWSEQNPRNTPINFSQDFFGIFGEGDVFVVPELPSYGWLAGVAALLFWAALQSQPIRYRKELPDN